MSQLLLDLFEVDSKGRIEKDMNDVQQNWEVVETKRIIRDTEIIELTRTGNYLKMYEKEINIPLEIIVFPFFTTRLNNREVNYEYHIVDMGMRFTSMLPGGRVFANNKYYDVFQPATFEKSLFDYLLFKYQEQIENSTDDKYIDFEIEEYISHYCGKKMFRSYKERVEQALINMKNTVYTFNINNRRKASSFTFESQNFNLLNYEKFEMEGKIIYRVYIFDELKRKIKQKRYIKAIVGPLMEIQDKDPMAVRIYQYISMTRFEKNEGEYKLELFCSIIPLKSFATITDQTKTGKNRIRKVSLLNKNLARIKESFELLKNLGYLQDFEVLELKEEKTWKFKYVFGDKLCHVSTYIKNGGGEIVTDKVKMVEISVDEKISQTNEKKEEPKDKKKFSSELTAAIEFARKNIYISKVYNDKIIVELSKNFSEERIISGLKKAKYSVMGEIKYFKSYLKKIMENIEIDKEEENVTVRVEEKNSKTLQDRNEQEKEEEIKLTSEDKRKEMFNKLFEALSEKEREEINKNAMDIYFNEIGNDKREDIVHINIYKKTEIFFRNMVIGERYGFDLANIARIIQLSNK